MATDVSSLFSGTLKQEDFDALKAAIIELQNGQQASSTGNTVSDGGNDPAVDIYDSAKLVLAKIDSADGKWHEQNVVGAEIVDYGTPGTDGRHCSDASEPSSFIELTSDQAVFIEVKDPPDHAYIRIPVHEKPK